MGHSVGYSGVMCAPCYVLTVAPLAADAPRPNVFREQHYFPRTLLRQLARKCNEIALESGNGIISNFNAFISLN